MDVIQDPISIDEVLPFPRFRRWMRQNVLCDHYSVYTARTITTDDRGQTVFACLRCGVCQKQLSPGVEFGKTEEPHVRLEA